MYRLGESSEELVESVIKYFDTLLVNYHKTNIYAISSLLNVLDEYSKNRLKEYWKQKHKYFALYCPDIVDIINNFFGETKIETNGYRIEI